MKGYLVDTNVLSELRRPKRSPSVVAWFSSVSSDDLYLSVLTLGELRQGIESMRRKDPTAANAAAHDLTIVTRNVPDFERSGVALFNPFEFSG